MFDALILALAGAVGASQDNDVLDIEIGEGVEPTIVTNRRTHPNDFLVIAWMPNGGTGPPRRQRSTDQGANWEQTLTFGANGQQDPALGANLGTTGASAGNIYFARLAPFSIGFNRSADGETLDGEQSIPTTSTKDHPWLVGSESAVYLSWVVPYGQIGDPDSRLWFKRGAVSGLDGAVDWSASSVKVAESPFGSGRFIAWDHALARGQTGVEKKEFAYAAFVAYTPDNINPATPNRLHVSRSEDGGQTWAATVSDNLYRGPFAGFHSARDGRMQCVALAGDKDRPNVYVFYVATDPGIAEGDALPVRKQFLYWRRSTDHGATWTNAQPVFTPTLELRPGQQQHYGFANTRRARAFFGSRASRARSIPSPAGCTSCGSTIARDGRRRTRPGTTGGCGVLTGTALLGPAPIGWATNSHEEGAVSLVVLSVTSSRPATTSAWTATRTTST